MRELIDGFIKMMTPAASALHQRTSGKLITRLINLIERKKGNCEVFPAPFDVRLPKNGEKANDKIYDVVQPDICVVCDPSKIDDKGCLGAPDLVVEIQSFSTSRYDLTEKFKLYEASGVREYWVVYPYKEEKGVIVFLLQPDGKYDKGTTYEGGNIPVSIFGGSEIAFEAIF
jgi:Uma2 family endonuclease